MLSISIASLSRPCFQRAVSYSSSITTLSAIVVFIGPTGNVDGDDMGRLPVRGGVGIASA